MKLRIFQYTTEGLFVNSPIHATMKAAAGDARPYMDSGDHVSWGQKEYVPGHQEIRQTGVKNGGIVIWDMDRNTALKRIAPAQVGRNSIADALKKLWGHEFDPANGRYVSRDGTQSALPTNDGFLPGFPIWGFDINLPPWAWLGIAIGGAVGVASSKRTLFKVGFGVLTYHGLKKTLLK